MTNWTILQDHWYCRTNFELATKKQLSEWLAEICTGESAFVRTPPTWSCVLYLRPRSSREIKTAMLFSIQKNETKIASSSFINLWASMDLLPVGKMTVKWYPDKFESADKVNNSIFLYNSVELPWYMLFLYRHHGVSIMILFVIRKKIISLLEFSESAFLKCCSCLPKFFWRYYKKW